MLWRLPERARGELAARLGPVEGVLLGVLVIAPIVFIWHFAAPSYFFSDDLADLFRVHYNGAWLSYALEPVNGHLSPFHRLAYLVIDRFAPMNFDVALAGLLAFHVVSAVLLQRILTLLFGRAWWTYLLALGWAISIVYLPGFAWFAGGLLSITAVTATLASIHGYLCWRATGRRAWLVWSLVAMCIGLAFYEKALLIPLYLILMRVLLLDPAARLRDSLRSLRVEWRVWLGYATVCILYLLLYYLGGYARPSGGVTAGDVPGFLGEFWVEGFSPAMFGALVPDNGAGGWDRFAMIAAQGALAGLLVWSIVRRRTAWRAWAFLLIGVAANAVMLLGRVSELGAGTVVHTVRYYTEPALLVPLAIAFAFAEPRPRARTAAAAPASTTWATPAKHEGFRVPTAHSGTIAVLALAAYVALTWTTANRLASAAPGLPAELWTGRIARSYFENLRADLAAARRTGVQPSLLDHEVPEFVVSQLVNLNTTEVTDGEVRFSLLSSVVPLFDRDVTFNQPGRLYVVQPDGHLQRTRFVPAAGGSPAKLRRTGRLRMVEAHAERARGEWCVVADGLSALEWEPHPHLVGHDWWLRVRYRTDPVEPLWLRTDAGAGWFDQGPELPAIRRPGTAIVPLSELPDGEPTNAGVSLGVPPFGRLCLRSLDIGYFDPPPPTP